MSTAQDLKNKSLSFKSFLLSFVLGLCLVMGGASLYAKYSLDQSESALASPGAGLDSGASLQEKTILSLGYGGFLGAAQEFMRTRDRAMLRDMRMYYKTAEETLIRVGDKASTPIRRDIRAILDLFASVISKAEEGDDALSQGLTNADLLAATTALSALEGRLNAALAEQRGASRDSFRNWGTVLLLLALSALALAAALAAWALFSAGGRQDEDLETLAQSVSNMVHGDIQKPVWGIERSDKLGALARTIDLARMYFTQVPDVSVMGQDGPIRLKFDGESRSLFQAMMRKITEGFERAQATSLGFTGTMNAQQEVLKNLVTQVQTALDGLQKQGASGEETVRSLSAALSEASRKLAKAQEEGVTQLTGLVPLMRERIQNMAEITHLAGTQVTQSLQALIASEASLRQSAQGSQAAVKGLSEATSNMGERMFAALNLMQATSKALGETIDSSQSRFNEAVDTLTRGEANMTRILSKAEERLARSSAAEENMAALVARTAASAEKLEKVVGTISTRHETLDEQILTAAHRMDAIVTNFDSAQRVLNDAAGQVRRDGAFLASVLAEVRANNEQLLAAVNQNSQTGYSAAQSLAERSHALMQRLEVQIEQQAQMAESRIDELTVHGQNMAQQAGATTASLAQTVASLKGEQEKLAAARSRFAETIGDLGLKLERHAASTFEKTEHWAAESFSKISTITEQMEGFLSRLAMLGQLTGTLGAVAGQLGQIVPALTGGAAPPAFLPGPVAEGGAPVSPDLEETKALIVQQTQNIIQELRDRWHEAVTQVEAMHDQLAQIVVQQKDQLETRLVVMDKKLRDATTALEDSEERLEAEEKQAEIINEVIAAITKINEHVLEIDGVIEEAGLRKQG